ncbi:autotransporter domain-containing protein [Anaerovibrio lipolyticus]|uniref:autotransporter domain-containing protein n=1 Tax=Anaerovibrio lipolyticus TaxID=82374 RepID=UPI001F26603C|nr:autotransporter outer membrane beta-barrel domain-containing protein [Anaerovibrio lipolyticus]MCF2601963.1 autotransporter domain-containing protein [Anaerovibrio lipolyticus]
MKKNDRQRFLVSSVLLGLSAGLSVLPMPNVAHAQTLNEYKADLAQRYPAYQAVLAKEAAESSRAAGEIVEAKSDELKTIVLDSNSQYQELRASGEGTVVLSVKDKSVIQPMTLRPTYGYGETDPIGPHYEGGYIGIAYGNVDYDHPENIKDNADKSADMTNVQFKAESGDIVFINGTTKVKAENLYGGQWYLPDGYAEDGKIKIGETEEQHSNPNDAGVYIPAHAILKLEGNTKFNTEDWQDSKGQTISGNNYIILTEKGTLEANSAQIFQKGMGLDGTNTNPNGVRQDANDAINFKAGKLLLDDESYNDAYLTQANKLIKEADNGSTEVVVKDTATKAAPVIKLDDVQHDNYAVGVTTDKSKITLGNGGDSAVNKLNATYLNMASTADGSANSITVKDSRNLYLGSNANNRELITVDNEKPAKSVDVQVQGGSKLTLGRFDVQNRLTGDVTLTADSEISVEAGQLTVGKIDAQTGTKINVGSGSALTTEGGIKLTGATMQVNGTVHNTNITGDNGSTILIGNNASAGKMLIGGSNTAALTGTKVFLDPVWKDGATISDASQFALESSNNVDYLLTVGRNSLASLGTADSSKAIAAFGGTGLKWGQNDISAAMYLAKPVTVDAAGGIKVDGTATDIATNSAVANIAEFADNSLLMVDASTLSGTAALTGAGVGAGAKLKVADSAKLYLDNVSTGGTYTIATKFDTTLANGWYKEDANIITGKLFSATHNTDSTITASRKKLQEALPGAVLPNIVDKMTFSAAEKAKSPASEFIAQATNGLYSDSMSTALINVAAQPAETVGATAAAVEHSLDFAQQAQGHLSFFNGADVKSDQAWIKYGHRNGSVDSLDIGGMSTGYDSSFNGVTVGYDLPAVDSFHHGFAFSYGKGSNDGAWENDDFNTKGVSWYGSLNTGDNNMLFDVGYYHTEHDVNGIFHAKPKTDVFTMGITNEFRLPQGNDGYGAIVPHIGLRYSHVGTPRYSGYWKGSEAFRYHPEGKDLFSLPFGVGYIYESKSPEQTTSFYADLAYVPVFGGRSADMRVQACGIDAEDVFAYDASYGSAFVGSLGVKQESDSWEWGLSYRYSANSNQHSNDIMANIAFKF